MDGKRRREDGPRRPAATVATAPTAVTAATAAVPAARAGTQPQHMAHPPYHQPDPTLDFCSEQFDAAKALATASLPLPYPRIKPMDNIASWHYRMVAHGERKANIAAREAKLRAAEQIQQDKAEVKKLEDERVLPEMMRERCRGDNNVAIYRRQQQQAAPAFLFPP
eukprot:m.86586 g.86586  ORF g.86586 m.86586 type:complete len:166 (+) comp14882_c0_seq3:269-766(+)